MRQAARKEPTPMCALSPSKIVLDYLQEPISDEELTVDFRLPYTGELLGASRTNTRAGHKHGIRRAFHPQMRRLWQTNSNLRDFSWLTGCQNAPTGEFNNRSDDDDNRYTEGGQVIIADNFARNGYRFIPLVTAKLALRCNIDILFLRPEEPGKLINSGDIDNRVKTLFDAMRIPNSLDECGGLPPQEGEDPFYVLLEDDRLISEVSITTDQLLLLPGERTVGVIERTVGPNHAFAVISVKLKPNVYGIDRLRFI